MYANGRQFTSKQELWKAMEVALRSVPAATIKKLTDTTNTRLCKVIKRKGHYINK